MNEPTQNTSTEECGTVDTGNDLLIHAHGMLYVPNKVKDQIVVNGSHGDESPISDFHD